MPLSPPLSSRASMLLGLLFVVSGIFPMLTAFDIGPLGREDIQGPSWLSFVAGGSFAAAGLAIIAEPGAPLWNRLFATLALAGLAAVGNWVAFGAGARVCSGSTSLSWAWGEGDFAGLACRIPFGIGAVMTDAFLCWMVAATLQKALGGPPRLARLLKAAEWLILASIAPLLLVLVAMVIVTAVAGAVRTRWTTGAWAAQRGIRRAAEGRQFAAAFWARGVARRSGGK